MTELNVKICLDNKRCHICGRWWSLETGLMGTCPRCARAEIQDLMLKMQKLQSSNNSLRGALTRSRKARSARV